MDFTRDTTTDQGSFQSIMDTVPVKIAEQYRPPSKITVSGGILQRRHASEDLQNVYDFSLEKSIIDKLAQMKQMRSKCKEDLQTIEQNYFQQTQIEEFYLKPEQQTTKENKTSQAQDTNKMKSSSSSSFDNTHENGESGRQDKHQFGFSENIVQPNNNPTGLPNNESSRHPSHNQYTPVDMSNSMPILQPIQLIDSIQKKVPLNAQLNLSEFESDTSSPFDNMELKSINDIAELADVLKQSKVTEIESDQSDNMVGYGSPQLGQHGRTSVHSEPSYGQHSPVPNQYFQNSDHSTLSPCQEFSPLAPPLVPNVPQKVKVPSILFDLRNELTKKREIETKEVETIDLCSPDDSGTSSSCDSEVRTSPTPPIQISHLDNPYLSLTRIEQSLVDRITEMGFLQSRTARACQIFGDKETRIIEFLVDVMDLEERYQIPGDKCEEVLIANNYDHHQTAAVLNTLKHFLTLGFKEDKVMVALQQHPTDLDKVMDFLVS